jgi:hypothetical protein
MKTKKDRKILKGFIKEAIQSARETFKNDKYPLTDNDLACFIAGYISGDIELKKIKRNSYFTIY